MRASRLVSLLLLLQTRGRMTAAALADELEVSVRTIYRDVDSLHAAGVPLYGDAGPQGGYQLLDGYRTRLTGLTESEAESLFLAGLPGPAKELGLANAVTAANLKLMAALPEDMRSRASRIASRFHLDAPGWHNDADDTPLLAEVAAAVWDSQVVEVVYRRWKAPEEVTRTLSPYGLVLKGGRWYLVAQARRGVATYRVAQILGLRVLDEKFDRPADFDLAGYWERSLADFESRRHTGEALIRLSPRGVERFPNMVLPRVAQAARDTALPDGGWTRVTVPIESIDHALVEFLRLGTDVEVLEPPELRERFVATARGLTEIYSSSSSSSGEVNTRCGS
ncbi:YafY family transcriptional regulator [Lentzea tibetensis]|uniref:YafY family transcriptional regulator n=1 Tax=Lentzea tibetensis TaxID=2591470 RepID=A0A563EPV7_9PSEU|nr:YafY family protein [Lentzea tibetensis]TWP49522.1 YafY family transcriptional regulator [Lentzea tibetensis]